MENTVSINKNKENTLEFSLTVEGLSGGEDLDVRLNIQTNRCDYVFKAIKDIQDKYKVTIPVMPELEKTMYPCRLEVITQDGYYFNAMNGNINVVTDANITGQPASHTPSSVVNKPTASIPTPPEEQVEDEEDIEIEITSSPDKKTSSSIADMTRKFINDRKAKDDLNEKQDKPKSSVGIKEESTKNIKPIKEDVKEEKAKPIEQKATKEDSNIRSVLDAAKKVISEHKASIKDTPKEPKKEAEQDDKKVVSESKKKDVVEPVETKEEKPSNDNDVKIKAILGEAGHQSAPKTKSPLIKKKSRTKG
jgi:hypothetical protein